MANNGYRHHKVWASKAKARLAFSQTDATYRRQEMKKQCYSCIAVVCPVSLANVK